MIGLDLWVNKFSEEYELRMQKFSEHVYLDYKILN